MLGVFRSVMLGALLLGASTPALAQEAAAPVAGSSTPPVMVVADDADGRRALARRVMTIKMADLEKHVRQDVEREVALLVDAPPGEIAWMRKAATDLLIEHGQIMGQSLETLFAEQFSVEELQALAELYESPVERTIARKEFEMGGELALILGQFQTGFLTDLLASYCNQFDCGEEGGKVPPSNKRGRS